MPLKSSYLRRFWFPVRGHFGIGVTAYTRDEAEILAREAASGYGWTFRPENVVEDVDIQTLDQAHVIPNMRAPILRGVWYPLR